MKEFTKSPGASFVIGIVGIFLPFHTFAQYRFVVEPSVEIAGVHDNNLFFSDDERPASDFIQRIRPTVDLRFESPRWSATTTYGLDSDRYSRHSALTSNRARERALVNVQHRSSPRLVVALEGAYTNTDTPADLNFQTGLTDSRIRVRRLTFGPSGRLQISPRISARASSQSTSDKLSDGRGMTAHVQTLGIARSMSPRGLFAFDYEQSFYSFDEKTATSRTSSYLLRAGWTRNLSSRTALTLQGGPRVTDGSATPELSASLTHRWKFSSMTVSCGQTQTTVVGHAGTLQTRNVTAMFTFAPTRSLTAYAAPAIHRSTQRGLEATAYRIGLGARYAVTPEVGFDVTYSHDLQRGILDPARANGDLSRGVLFVGVSSRWIGRDGTGGIRLK